MLTYVLRRILWGVLTMLLVLALVFLIFFVLPGGAGHRTKGERFPPVAYLIAGRHPTASTVRAIVRRLDLNRPVYVQFGAYVARLVRGDLGFSYNSREPVARTLLEKLPATAELAAGAAVVWLLLGVVVGTVSALRRGHFSDRSAMLLALAGLSIPPFWLGLLAILMLDSHLHIYDTGSYVGVTQNPLRWFDAMWLPWVVLAVGFAAIYSRILRGNILDVADEDYVRTARAKGLSESRIVLRHILRSAVTPLLTMTGMDIGILFGGAIVIEQVFNIPGVGAWVVGAIASQDLPIVLGVTLVAAAAVVTFNLLVDIAYAVLDPRVRLAAR